MKYANEHIRMIINVYHLASYIYFFTRIVTNGLGGKKSKKKEKKGTLLCQ